MSELLPITHGESVTFKKSTYQAHAAAIRSTEELAKVLEQLRASFRWSACNAIPYAYRIQKEDESDEAAPEQGCQDDKELGAGDKLLHLLERWDIQNVVVVVTRRDAGMPGRLGAQRFRVLLDRAKAVLEQCYLDALNSYDEGADEMMQNSGVGMDSVPAVEPQQEVDPDGMLRRSAGQRGQWTSSVKPGLPVPMGKCALDSRTVPWPRGHKPTPNGGHVGEKQGQIASYLAPDQQVPAVGQREEWSQEEIDRIVAAQNGKNSRQVSSPVARGPHSPYAMAGHEFEFDDSELVQSIDVLSLYGVLQPPNITQATIIELKSMRQPPEKVQQVLVCVAILLGVPHDTWYECRDMVSHEEFRSSLLMMDVGRLHPKQIQVVKSIIKQPEFVPELMSKVSPVASELLRWVGKAVQIFDLIQAAREGKSGPSAMSSSHRGDAQIDPATTVTHQTFSF